MFATGWEHEASPLMQGEFHEQEPLKTDTEHCDPQ